MPVRFVAVYALFFLSGVSGLLYQVVWVREFGNVFGNTVHSAATVTAVFLCGLGIGSLLHHIMEHTAHHVDMSIPLYRLKGAQRLLEEALPARITVQRFSWRWYFSTARKCKLYDFDRQCWTDFEGRQTS